MIEHAEQIARERHAAGYDLFEVQTAINVIEEALWKRILSSVEPDELAHALGMVNAIFGMSKDVLARTYVSLATNQETPRKELDEILDG
jgi:DNA-binding phage protein